MSNKGFSHIGLSTLDLDKTRAVMFALTGALVASSWARVPASAT
jgi:hypothetical protein